MKMLPIASFSGKGLVRYALQFIRVFPTLNRRKRYKHPHGPKSFSLVIASVMLFGLCVHSNARSVDTEDKMERVERSDYTGAPLLALQSVGLEATETSGKGPHLQKQESKVIVKLNEEQPLQLFKFLEEGEETEDVFLKGVLRISITNGSSSPARLVDMGVHNLLFINRETGKETLVIHRCACMMLIVNSEVVNGSFTLNPGDKKKIIIDRWGCDSAWTPPEPGMYQLMYRIIRFESLREKLPKGSPASIGKNFEKCVDLLQSDQFWQDAVLSNAVDIRLKEPVQSKTLW